ncbi:MAG TPA: CHASE2 domain-containing protein [Smithellaceae bacterium]|nr:CHASE2 domain-containing protein [Smithellaceae bacterium]
MKEKIKKYFRVNPLKITLFVIVLALVLFFFDFPFLRFMELKTLDLRIASRGALPTGGETVIAVIDEKSLTELGRWPWPRTTVARLIDKLKASGAKAVGFDIVFSEPDDNSSIKTISELSAEIKKSGIRDANVLSLLSKKKAEADNDVALAKAISRAKNVTLGYFFHLSSRDVMHLSEKEIQENADSIKNSRYQIINSAEKSPDDFALAKAYAPEANLKILSDAAVNSGYFNMIPDSDGSMRWSPLVIKFRNNYYSSLPLSILQQYLDWPPFSLSLAGYGAESVKIGDIHIPTDEAGRLLVNYMGPAKTFPHYSVSDIMKGRIPAETFRNKIVLVGATAIGIYDLRVTPFGATYPGVEIHATVIDNILHSNFLLHSSFTRFIDLCAIIIFGLLMGLIIPRLRAVTGIIFAIILLIVFVAFNMFIFSGYNVWLNLIYPALTMLVIYLGITVYRYITEEREKKKIRGAFQYYLTASVINEMLKDPSKLKLGGDKKDLSVLFSDIRGFTTISEKLSPEELVHLLNEYLTAMTDIVFKYDGTLDKYMGDAIMAVFGAPLDQPDHAKRACLTALDMMAELHRLQKKWQEEGKPPLNIGIGINSGDMVVGNMGSQMRFDYTVMGDMVNLGSRLEGINKEYGSNIIFSEFTYNVVKDAMCCRELDWVRVKGKKLPVKIYELLGEKKDEGRWKEFISKFEEGLALYRAAKWDEAIAAFREAMKIKPEDAASQLYIERCKNLQENPPPEPWDGVFTMTRK